MVVYPTFYIYYGPGFIHPSWCSPDFRYQSGALCGLGIVKAPDLPISLHICEEVWKEPLTAESQEVIWKRVWVSELMLWLITPYYSKALFLMGVPYMGVGWLVIAFLGEPETTIEFPGLAIITKTGPLKPRWVLWTSEVPKRLRKPVGVGWKPNLYKPCEQCSKPWFFFWLVVWYRGWWSYPSIWGL